MRKRTTRFNVQIILDDLRGEEEIDEDDLFDDEEIHKPAGDDETSFDDVAMILLLFFMVTALLVVISPEPEGAPGEVPYTMEKADPAKAFAGVTHRLMISPHRAGGIQMSLAGVGPARDEPMIVRGPFLKGGSADVDLDLEDFQAGFKELLGDDKVPPVIGETAPKPVYLVNHFPHDVDNDTVLTTWFALAQMAKDPELAHYAKKVRFTRWRAQVKQ